MWSKSVLTFLLCFLVVSNLAKLNYFQDNGSLSKRNLRRRRKKGSKVRVLNYNVGGFIPTASVGFPKIMESIGNQQSNYDIIVLQEVFLETQMADTLATLSTQFPHFITGNNVDVNLPAGTLNCPNVQTDPTQELLTILGYSQCLLSQCDTTTFGFFACIQMSAAACLEPTDPNDPASVAYSQWIKQILTNNGACLTCLRYNLVELTSITDTNLAVQRASELCSNPATTFNYAANTGTIIFSRYPITLKDVVGIPYVLGDAPRPLTVVDVSPPNQPKFTVAFTHLTGSEDFDSQIIRVDYSTPNDPSTAFFDTSKSEKLSDNFLASVNGLLTYLNANFNKNDDLILLGDFNTGPKYDESVRQGYFDILKAGFRDTAIFSRRSNVRKFPCTFCSEANTPDYNEWFSLGLSTTQVGNVRIDHIFVRGKNLRKRSDIEKVVIHKIRPIMEFNGVTVPAADHWSIEATLRI